MVTKYAKFISSLPSFIFRPISQLWYDKEYPRHIFIELNSSCNLSCDYCPRKKESQNMDWDTFKGIIDEAREHGARSFSLHLFGEPLLYPRIIEAVEYIKRSNRNNTILLTTNGTLLSKNYQALVRAGCDKIVWSYKTGQVIPEEAYSWEKVTIRFMDWEEKDFPRKEVRKAHNYGGKIDTSKFGVKNTDGSRYPCYHLWYAPAVAVTGEILICCSDPKRESVVGKFPSTTLSQAWKKMEIHRINQKAGNYNGICAKCDVWKAYPRTF